MKLMSKRKLILLLATIALILVIMPEAKAVDSCSQSPVIDLSGSQTISGNSNLCVTDKGIKAQVGYKDLTAGDAYTVWWVYFDDPSQCATAYQCGLADFAGAKPLAIFGRFASVIGPENGSSQMHDEFTGMKPSSGSQIWLFLFGHGQAAIDDPERLARQLLTPEDPFAGAPHLGNFVDGPLGHPTALNIHNIP